MADNIPTDEQLQQQYDEQRRLNTQGILNNRPQEYQTGQGSFAGEFFRTLAAGGNLSSALMNGTAAGVGADWWEKQQQDTYIRRADAWNTASKNTMTAGTEVDKVNAVNRSTESDAKMNVKKNEAAEPYVGELTKTASERKIAENKFETTKADIANQIATQNKDAAVKLGKVDLQAETDKKALQDIEDKMRLFGFAYNQSAAKDQMVRQTLGKDYATAYPAMRNNRTFQAMEQCYTDIRTVALAMNGDKTALMVVKNDLIPRLEQEGIKVVEDKGKYYLSNDGVTKGEPIDQETMMERFLTLKQKAAQEKEAYDMIYGEKAGVVGLLLNDVYKQNEKELEPYGYYGSVNIMNGVLNNPMVGPERVARSVLLNAYPKLTDTNNKIDSESKKLYENECMKLLDVIGAKYDAGTPTAPIIYKGQRYSIQGFSDVLKAEEETDPGSVTKEMKRVFAMKKQADMAEQRKRERTELLNDAELMQKQASAKKAFIEMKNADGGPVAIGQPVDDAGKPVVFSKEKGEATVTVKGSDGQRRSVNVWDVNNADLKDVPGHHSSGYVVNGSVPVDIRSPYGNMNPDGSLSDSAIEFLDKYGITSFDEVDASKVASVIPLFGASMKNVVPYINYAKQTFFEPEDLPENLDRLAANERTKAKRITGVELKDGEGVWNVIQKIRDLKLKERKIMKELKKISPTVNEPYPVAFGTAVKTESERFNELFDEQQSIQEETRELTKRIIDMKTTFEKSFSK